jgi:phosphomevalonate kinase
MLARVAELGAARPTAHRAIMQRLSTAADAAVQASDGARFIGACRAQLEALSELGEASGAPIVTAEMRALDEALIGEAAVALPSGAGGGDVVLLISTAPLDPRAVRRAEELGFSFLSLSLGARGVHRVRAPFQATHEAIS